MDGRERISKLLDAVVGRARGMLDGDRLPPEEVSNVMRFYVLADHLLAAARDSAQPMHATALAGGLIMAVAGLLRDRDHFRGAVFREQRAQLVVRRPGSDVADQ